MHAPRRPHRLRAAGALALLLACDPAPADRAPAPAAAPKPDDARSTPPAAPPAPAPDRAPAPAEPAARRVDPHDEPAPELAPAITRPPPVVVADEPLRYRPRLLDEAPAPAAIAPGDYRCKVSREYKLRPCTVRVDERGHTRLTIPEALIALEGVVYDEGRGLRFDGWPTEARPFGCFTCDERCTVDPSSCACTELPPAASAHCLAQPVAIDFKADGKGWKGTLRWGIYYSRYQGDLPGRRPVGYEIRTEDLVVELRPL